MKNTLEKIIIRFGVQLCGLAMFVAPLVSEVCRGKYYQPIEPEGLATFAKNNSPSSIL